MPPPLYVLGRPAGGEAEVAAVVVGKTDTAAAAEYHLTERKSFIVGANCRHVNFGSAERGRVREPGAAAGREAEVLSARTQVTAARLRRWK